MNCCHCGRRIVKAAGETERGPVGPICAQHLGLPRPVPRLRKDGLPRRRPVRICTARTPSRDERQLELLEVAA